MIIHKAIYIYLNNYIHEKSIDKFKLTLRVHVVANAGTDTLYSAIGISA